MIDRAPFQAKTDETGTASVKNLPVGRHYLSINDDNWRLPLFDGKYPASVREVQAGRDNDFVVTVTPQGSSLLAEPPTIGLDDSLSADKPSPARKFPTQAVETELAGVVVDEQGEPLAGVDVDVWTWHPGNETVTDAEGRFRLDGFERRMEIEVEFTKEGYSPSLYAAIPAGTDNWTIVLTQGTWIEGKVLDPAGNPAAGALVRAWRGPFENEHGVIGEVWSETRADDDGTYRMHVEPDTYNVQVRVPDVGSVRHANVNVGHKEKKQFDLKLDKGVTFRAVVRDSVSRNPVEGIVLWNWRQPGIEGTSDARGVIEIRGMMPGEFEFGVSAAGVDRRTDWGAGDYARWWSESAMQPFQRAGELDRHGFRRNFDYMTFNLQGDVYDVEIFVEQAVTITGRVFDPDGHPVAGAIVAPAKTGTGNSLTGDTRFSYETDAEGRYTMKLPASHDYEYNLIAHDGAHGEWRQWANGIAAPIRTTPGQLIENVDLLLTRPGTVRGRVLDAGGDPRPHVEVRAARVDQHDNRYYMPTTKSDEDGGYELKFVSPGEHRVQIQKDGMFWLDPDQAPFDTTRTVTVKAGETVEDVDFMAD
jgi:protocatechuate 3,4-dioxygenase beta subunit